MGPSHPATHGTIQIVAEQWYSPDLEAVVSSRHYDPRAGETTYRLVNVARGDPSGSRLRIRSCGVST